MADLPCVGITGDPALLQTRGINKVKVDVRVSVILKKCQKGCEVSVGNYLIDSLFTKTLQNYFRKFGSNS